jgi:nucleoside-diphosphate-sugar epimerase
MSRTPVVLVTGAGGEIGHGLIARLAAQGRSIVALDLRDPGPEIRSRCLDVVTGDILDQRLLERMVSEFEIHSIFHLAALLSTRTEFSPETGHNVNVTGTLNLLRLAVDQSRWHGRRVPFLFPSSIAVYGFADAASRRAAGAVREDQALEPITMYGANKLYCEHLGRYYSRHYRQLAAEEPPPGVDFRAIRFPGLLSAETTPTGGTSDYLPLMVHAAARGEPYPCFVREDTRIPFMAMPDAVEALLCLHAAPVAQLSRHTYNIAAFNPSAAEFAELVRRAFPASRVTFEPDSRRQTIVDSWPEDVDDRLARADWGHAPRYDLERTLFEYLVPGIRAASGR